MGREIVRVGSVVSLISLEAGYTFSVFPVGIEDYLEPKEEVSSRVVDRLPNHAATFCSLPSTNAPFSNPAPALTSAIK
jgi:hypothetical protein